MPDQAVKVQLPYAKKATWKRTEKERASTKRYCQSNSLGSENNSVRYAEKRAFLCLSFGILVAIRLYLSLLAWILCDWDYGCLTPAGFDGQSSP